MNASVKYCQIADILLSLANVTLSVGTRPISGAHVQFSTEMRRKRDGPLVSCFHDGFKMRLILIFLFRFYAGTTDPIMLWGMQAMGNTLSPVLLFFCLHLFTV